MDTDGDICSTSPKGDSLEHLATTGQCDDKPYTLGLGVQEDHKGTLDSIWYKATEMCQSSRLKTFLRKQGKLSSVCISQGIHIVLYLHYFFVQRLNLLSSKLLASLCNIILSHSYGQFFLCLFLWTEMLATYSLTLSF